MNDKQTTEQLVELFQEYQGNAFRWIEDALGLTPQRIYPEYRNQLLELYTCPASEFNEKASKITLSMFKPFQKGKEITWQQSLVIIAIQRILKKELPMRIAIRSARGTGKSSLTAILLFYWLSVFPMSKAMVTSPSADQLSDALWAEIAKYHGMMNEPFKGMFEVQSTYVRLKEAPQAVFATARTARKENPSALSGIHSEYLLAVGEEAAEIPEEVYAPARLTLTQEFNIFYLISQPLKLEGSFYEAFHGEADRWVLLHFDGLLSPIFDMTVEQDTREKYGIDSYEYQTSIRGNFPKAQTTDGAWFRYFSDEWIEKVLVTEEEAPIWAGRESLGVDVAGSGGNETVGVLRASRTARIAFAQPSSDKASVSGAIHAVFGSRVRLSPYDVCVDAFGTGHDVTAQVLFDSPAKERAYITALNVGEPVPEEDLRAKYVNMRACLYDALRIWGNNGGRVINHPRLIEQLKSIRAMRVGARLKIMSKQEMRKNGYQSPDHLDSLTLSFGNEYSYAIDGRMDARNQVARVTRDDSSFDKHNMIP